MNRFCFKKGLSFWELQLFWVLVRRLASGLLQFEQEGTGEIRNFTDSEVLAKWMRGEWVVDESSLGSLRDVMYLATPRDLASFPQHQQEEARRREHYIRHVESTPFEAERWQTLIQAAAISISDPKPPSSSTVHGWWRRFRDTRNICVLVSHQGRRKQMQADARYQIFEEVISEVYLNSQKRPKSDVYDAVRKKFTLLNANRAPAEQLKTPSRATIYNWLDQLHQDIVDGARLGADAARVKYRMVTGSVKTREVLERVEIDHTPLDLLVIDAITAIPIGRPWLSLAIDRHSRMIMGFYISFNAPSTHSVLQCIRHAILPKDEWLARFPEVEGPWPAHGIMDLIAVDNGMDLHSEGLRSVCQELGMEILFCPAAEPQYKAVVERFFRTLEKGLIHRLPGTVFSSVDERGDYPSESLAAITLETLVQLITKWIVDVYNKSYHRGIETTPLAKWNESAPHRQIDLPVHPQSVEVITGIPATRTVFHYGIELDGLHYNSRQLREIRARKGQNIKVQLKFYEHSVDYVHVFDDAANEYIQVPAINANYAGNMPRPMHRLVREHARRVFGEQYSLKQLDEAKEMIEAKIKASIDFKKMASRKAAAAVMHADSEAVLRNADPLESARTLKKSVAPQLPEELPGGLNDALPAFQSLSLNFQGDAP